MFNTDWLVVKLRFRRQLDPVSVVPIKEALIIAESVPTTMCCSTVTGLRLTEGVGCVINRSPGASAS